MSVSRHRTEIESALIGGMKLLYPDMVLMGENADVDHPATDPWVRMSLVIIDVTHPCLGKDDTQTDGMFNVQVFTPIGSGAGEASTLVDEARKILKSSTLTGIEFLSFSVSTGELESDWYTLLLRADYRAQDED